MVERILGKAEVGSSILPGGTSFPLKINPQPGALIHLATLLNVIPRESGCEMWGNFGTPLPDLFDSRTAIGHSELIAAAFSQSLIVGLWLAAFGRSRSLKIFGQ